MVDHARQLIFIYGTLRENGPYGAVSQQFERVAKNILTDAAAFTLREFSSISRPDDTSPGMSRVETHDPDAGRVRGDIVLLINNRTL